MADRPDPIALVFWQSHAGREPVREWIRGLGKEDRRVIGFDLRLVQFGWPIGMPLCRVLGGGLWELRSNLGAGRISRVIFAFNGGKLVLLNSFIKKTPKTPLAELELAKSRLKDLTL